ncbi:antirestriction protein ArdA, partial [Stenotrophomonas maltophilia]|uniref:antirestriction protein ArdA n=1 Tax=Stenotrophomonas maltophilia TaxID=40324 RepID=UPI0013D91BA3
MRIYVACLASYNAGVLHGEWIDLEGRDADDVRDEIARILRESPHPNVTVDCPDCGGTGTTYVPRVFGGAECT